MPPEEIERAEKFLKATSEGGPGGCKGEACRAYCNGPAHQDECFEFAKVHDLIDEHEAEAVEKFKTLRAEIKKSGGPGGCDSEESCHAYCSDASHAEECVAFAVDKGVFLKEEAIERLKEFREMESKFRQFEGFNGDDDASEQGPGRPRPIGPPIDIRKFEQNFDEQRKIFEEKREEIEKVFRERQQLNEEEFKKRREEIQRHFESRQDEFEARRREMEERFRSEGRDIPEGFFHGGPPGTFPGRGQQSEGRKHEAGGERIFNFPENTRSFPREFRGELPNEFRGGEGIAPQEFPPEGSVPFPHAVSPEGQFVPQENSSLPPASFTPPEGSFVPENQFRPSTEGTVLPPPPGSETFIPPPTDATAPSGETSPPPPQSLLLSPANLLSALIGTLLGQ